jgi:Asp-tRNA(Asn)/Glu-tRNA(Gln) amidotransferase A subunit family amidase
VKEVTLPPLLEEAWRIHRVIQNYEAVRALAFEHDHHRAQMSKLLGEVLDSSVSLSADEYDAARRTSKRARQTFAELMADFDIMLTPSAAGAAPHGLASTGDAKFNRLWTLLGSPCINVARLNDSNGLPLGVQVVGRFGRDRNALDAARFVENALPVS